jgi:hypothetical protein
MNREATFFGHEKFLCYWRTGTDNHVAEIHGADFFCADNGYSDEDIETLANIHISESADISGPTQTHYVMRIA